MGLCRLFLALSAPLLSCLPAACSPAERVAPVPAASPTPSAPSSAALQGDQRRVVTIVGTNDLHGRVAALPLLAGYVARLRALRANDGGVVLVDAGDMFQGTLESNLAEGLPVVSAYGAMGYHAVAIGNHEFDFGPAGPSATPREPGDDPRGALKAAAAAASFPFLAANVVEAGTKKPLDWPNVKPSALIDVGGVKVGLIGVTTKETLATTISANVSGLEIAPLAPAVANEARALRAAGAAAVVAIAHAGGKCKAFTGDVRADGCEDGSEAFQLARDLPDGLVDVLVAGHTHAGVAHEVEGVAIIEQHAYGRAFGRVDLVVSGGKVVDKHVFAPRSLCPNEDKPDFAACAAGEYEGAAVQRDPKVAAAVQPAIEGAKQKREERIGTELPDGVQRDYDDESALGNLFADLVREARPGADVGLMNGGGLRADLPKGTLSYGSLFEAFPFDNRLAVTELTGKDFRELVRGHLARGGGILSFSGVTVKAACKDGAIDVAVTRAGKARRVGDDEKLVVVGSDFLFTGGDDFWGELTPPRVQILDELMRDALERGFKKRTRVGSREVFDKDKPRLSLGSRRPMQCKR